VLKVFFLTSNSSSSSDLQILSSARALLIIDTNNKIVLECLSNFKGNAIESAKQARNLLKLFVKDNNNKYIQQHILICKKHWSRCLDLL